MFRKSIKKFLIKFFNKLKKLFRPCSILYFYYLINDKKFENQLETIIESKDYHKLTKLIKLWPDFVRQKSAHILNECIDSRSYDVLNYLLSQNLIDKNIALDEYGWTALHRAIYNKDLDVIDILLKNEANIDVMDINGNTPFHILLQSSTQVSTAGNKSVSDCEPDSHYSIIILKLLVDYCKSRTIDMLNKRNRFGKTVLHYSVINTGTDPKTMLSLMSILLDSGCNPDARDRLNRTPLFCALTEQSFSDDLKKQIIVKLIQSDCDPLNSYQFRQFGTGFTLKQLSRSCLLNGNPKQTQIYLSNKYLPKELKNYLNVKLVSLNK